jgi:hypothetical protein
MAKKKTADKKPKSPDGPHLSAAFFCERVIEENQDKAMSIVRIIDTLIVDLPPDAPQDVPSKEHRISVNIAGLIAFKTGMMPGEHLIQTIIESPSGEKSKPLYEHKVIFPPEPQSGFNLKLKLAFAIKSGGLYLMHVLLDGKLITKMPLMVNVVRTPTPVPVPAATKTNGAAAKKS